MNCNKIVLRPYQPEDLEQIITLYQASVRQLAAGDYTPGQIAAWSTCYRERWQRMMSSGQILLAIIGERIAGFSRTEPDGYLDLLFTHPDFPRRGVATRLADRLESDLRQQGIKQVTTHGSITAQPFYLGRGYQVLEQQQVEVRGETFVNYRMSKALSEES